MDLTEYYLEELKMENEMNGFEKALRKSSTDSLVRTNEDELKGNVVHVSTLIADELVKRYTPAIEALREIIKLRDDRKILVSKPFEDAFDKAREALKNFEEKP